jgi:predicted metal-dependent enzyme (double-stranded beta helix superfamily)
MATLDVEALVEACTRAVRSTDPVSAVTEELLPAVSDASAVEAALGNRMGSDMGLLHVSDDLVLQRVIFPKGYATGLHEHRLWTVSAVYAGCERHDLHRVVDDRLEPLGEDDARAGQVRVLAPDVAHSSASVGDEHLGVFHVYLGNLFATGAGEWDTPSGRRRDFSDAWLERLLASLAEADLIAP